MRSLFLKIFLWFWGAMTLLGAIAILLSLTIDPKAAAISRYEKRLAPHGLKLAQAFEGGGAEALTDMADRLEEELGLHLFLFRGADGPLCDHSAPPASNMLAAKTLATGSMQYRRTELGNLVAQPIKGGYILVSEKPLPSRLQILLNPNSLGPRLAASFLIAGVVCYLLARSLTAPILRLRTATQQFASGQLSTRVSGSIGGIDEVADLARDFDRMAERIEGLVGYQRRLLRDISHELRSPLARLNLALALARQKSGEELAAPLDRIEREGIRLNELIGQLLTLTLLENGVEKVGRIPVDLARLVEDVAADADFEARGDKREVRVKRCDDLTVLGSREMLHRALENVVRNAVRHTAETTAVEISLEMRKDRSRETAVIRVRDHGPGVPEPILEKLFLPFFRAEDDRDRRSGGAGIGLAITEQAIRFHGGAVVASNAPDGGLVIEMVLPVRPGAEDPPEVS